VTYSVPARWIGQEVKVEVYEGRLKIYQGRQLLSQVPRATGDRWVVIDYRHLIEHLLRKPRSRCINLKARIFDAVKGGIKGGLDITNTLVNSKISCRRNIIGVHGQKA
jgi:hypothetical protein